MTDEELIVRREMVERATHAAYMEGLGTYLGWWLEPKIRASLEAALSTEGKLAPPLDPKPYYVMEADEGQPDGGRYTVEEVNKSADEGEWGGIVYNLAKWQPRPGYSQNKEDYACRLADALEAAEAERDAALAVIEKARVVLSLGTTDEALALSILSSVPADVLRERDAEKWDEGWDASGEGWNGEYLPPGHAAPNPYRIEQNSEGNET